MDYFYSAPAGDGRTLITCAVLLSGKGLGILLCSRLLIVLCLQVKQFRLRLFQG